MTESLRQFAEVLQLEGALVWVWRTIVFAAGVYLLTLAMLIFFRREHALRFLGGFAATRNLNTLECLLRLIAGLAFIGASPQMRFATAFAAFGAVLIVTSIPMLAMYDTHRRYAGWAIPFVSRVLPVFGAGAAILGTFVIFSLLSG